MARISVSSEAELVDVVRAERESRRTMEIVGLGTKRGLGRPIECDDVLDLSGLSGIVKYEPDEMVITALAGTPVAEIEAALAEKNQRLAFEPADWGPLYGAPSNSATIGGVLAADASGSAAIRYGRCRDHLLGYRAVNGFGEAYKAGGKVVKNVTGFDLPKLMCGAMGTLGPMTEVTLRAFPKPDSTSVVAIVDVSPENGFSILRRVWQSPVEATVLALFSNEAASHLSEFGVTAIPFDPTDDRFENVCAVIIRLEGTTAALNQKRDLLAAILSGFRAHEISSSGEILVAMSSATSFVDTAEDVWLLQVPPVAALQVVRRAAGTWIADWAGARLWIRGPSGGDGVALRKQADTAGGFATLVRASTETRKRVASFTPELRAPAELTKRVKAAFDPLRLFNPGRMWDGV
jgi:glycolate oxidase FAD binding subunit